MDVSTEPPPLTATILRKTEASKDVAELLLEANHKVVYCWMEGEHWVRKLRLLEEGETVLVSAYRWFALPVDSPMTPAIPNKTVSPGYIYVAPSDAKFQIMPQRSRAYPPLASILYDAYANPWTKRDIIGTVTDVSIRDFGSESLATFRLTDESLSVGKCLYAHVLSKKLGPHSVHLRSIGDVIAIHGCTLQLHSDKPQISASRSSNGWGLFSFHSGDLHSHSVRFAARAETMDRVTGLREWTDQHYRKHSVCGLQDTVPSLGALGMFVYRQVDFVGKVVARKEGFPAGKVTVVITDEAGYTSIELSDSHSSPIVVGQWVKVSKAKITRSLEVSQCAAVISIPAQFFDVELHQRNYALFGDTVVEEEAVSRLHRKLRAWEERRETVGTLCEEGSLPLWSAGEVMSTMSNRRRVRIKALFIDLQPSPLISGFYQDSGQCRYSGLLRLYADSTVLPVLLTETEGKALFRDFAPTVSGLRTVAETIALLMTGNCWMEVGVERVVAGEQVVLRLYRTKLV